MCAIYLGFEKILVEKRTKQIKPWWGRAFVENADSHNGRLRNVVESQSLATGGQAAANWG
jgi:hypothetical protein